jgi:hypothetical protein
MQVSRHIFQRVNKEDELRYHQTGDLINAINCRISNSENGNTGAVENIKGNVLINIEIPVGTNKIIGQLENKEKNTVLYFLFNSNGDHTIYEFFPKTNSIELVIRGTFLQFQEISFIQASVIDDILTFTDGVTEIKQINIQRAKNGFYADAQVSDITLIKGVPLEVPLIERVSTLDADLTVNRIAQLNIQVGYRFTYVDNEKSPFSVLSKISPADKTPLGSNTNRALRVRINIPKNKRGFLKNVELIFRNNNSVDYNIFETVRIEDVPVAPSGNFDLLETLFTNSKFSTPVPITDSVKLFDNVPRASDAIVLFRNAIIANQKVLNYTDDGSYNIIFSLDRDLSPNLSRQYLKPGGSYSVGIIWYDQYGRSSTVKDVQTVNVSYATQEDVRNMLYYLQISVEGQAPSWATHYQFVISEEQSFEIYAQYNVNLLFYIAEVDVDTSPGSNEFLIGQSLYLKDLPTTSTGYSFLHLQTPLNIPFVPDQECFVRVLAGATEIPLTTIEPVLEVRGDKIVVNNFEKIDWSTSPGNFKVEVFKPKQENTNIFFETGIVHTVSQIGDVVRIDADTFLLTNDAVEDKDRIKWRYDQLTLDETGPNYTVETIASNRFLSPAPSFQATLGSTDQQITFSSRPFTSIVASVASSIPILGRLFRNSPQPVRRTTTLKSGYVLDYQSITANYGRFNVEFEDEEENKFPHILSYSEKYVEDSFINGLNSWLDVNVYPLPIERTPIRALVPTENVVLAIHERNVTSLYIGESFIETANENALLAKSERYIADDRRLKGDYGTVNPESIAVHRDNVYFFDAYQGAIVRYSVNGLFPISSYKMESYFYTLSRNYLGTDAKIVGGFDPYHMEYIISFPAINDIPSQTWVFSERTNSWVGTHQYVPDLLSKVNNSLLSFKNGQLYVHNKNELYNNFYGVQYDRLLEFTLVDNPSKVKVLNNVHIHADNLGGTERDVVIEIEDEKGLQQTYIEAQNFEDQEEVYKSDVLNVDDLYFGDPIRARVFKIKYKDNRTDASPLYFIDVTYRNSENSF